MAIESDPFCDRLRALFVHPRMAERIAIWHPGDGQDDQACIQLEDTQDMVDPISGLGATLEEAMSDLERQVTAQGGV